MRIAARAQSWMTFAVIVSLAAHAALLAVRFVPPPAPHSTPFDSRLPVILVNARSATVPLKADALAQSSLDGGGDADRGRARSPLPDLGRVADGDRVDAQRQQVAALEQRQQQLLQQWKRPPLRPSDADNAKFDERADRAEHALTALARTQAELERDIADYNARPRKRQLTPSTREVPYAMYYTALRKKIEQTGTRHFPRSAGAALYGELIISIPVQQDGLLYDGDGGPRIERSSGKPLLDAAALAIVRRAAPFGRLPLVPASDGVAQVWEVVARFSFTREQQLETKALAESKE